MHEVVPEPMHILVSRGNNEKFPPKDRHVLGEEHVDMHEVAPQPMHKIVVEQEDSNKDNFWDKLEVFFSSLTLKNLLLH